MVGVRLDPTPLFTGNDPDYMILYRLVTNATVDEFNRVHGGKG